LEEKDMKNFVKLLVVCMMVLVAFGSQAGDKYSYGKRKAFTLVSGDTIDIAPNNITYSVCTLALDTSAVVDVDVDNSIIGDKILLVVTPDGNRELTWGANITGNDGRVIDAQVKLFEFVYNGTEFKQVAEAKDGNDYVVALTSGATIALAPANTLTLYTLSAAHTATFNATVTLCKTGDRVILKAIADGTNRVFTFNTNMTAVTDSVVATKTKLWEFIFDGTKLIQVGEVQID
jgi:hypothetical protein